MKGAVLALCACATALMTACGASPQEAQRAGRAAESAQEEMRRHVSDLRREVDELAKPVAYDQTVRGEVRRVANRMRVVCRDARRDLSPPTPVKTNADRARLAERQLGALEGMRQSLDLLRWPRVVRRLVAEYESYLMSSIETTRTLVDRARNDQAGQVALLVREQRELRALRGVVAELLLAPEC